MLALATKFLGRQSGFKGTMPVAVDRKSLEREIANGNYAVSFKADGTRALVGICEGGKVFLLDRKETTTQLHSLSFNEVYDGTLFDCEVLGENALLVFDCISANQKSCQNFKYPDRLKIACRILAKGCSASKKTIYNEKASYSSAEIPGTGYQYEFMNATSLKFTVLVKTLFYAKLLKHVPTRWVHQDDGLVWTMLDAPYGSKVYKWKDTDCLTVDFEVLDVANTYKLPEHRRLMELEPRYRKFQISTGNNILGVTGKPFSWITDGSEHKDLECGKIYECIFLKTTWKVVRERKDKMWSNGIATVLSTLDAVLENLTRKDVELLTLSF